MSAFGSLAGWKRGLSLVLAIVFAAPSASDARCQTALARQFDGLNVIAAPGHPFGSGSAKLA
jgi:hypothetical protein